MISADSYLHRLQLTHPLSTDSKQLLLFELHNRHNFLIPFENLDIILGKYHSLDLPSLTNRILQQHRGGYCYELNALFGQFLQTLGFEVTMHNARIRFGSKELFPRGHQLMTVTTDEGIFLADVGYRNGLIEPMPLRNNTIQQQFSESFRLTQSASGEWLLQKLVHKQWEDLYSFYTIPCEPVDFEPLHFYNSHSSHSIFTNTRIVSLKTTEGSISLIDNTMVIFRNGTRINSSIHSPKEYHTLLKDCFRIDLSVEEIERLYHHQSQDQAAKLIKDSLIPSPSLML